MSPARNASRPQLMRFFFANGWMLVVCALALSVLLLSCSDGPPDWQSDDFTADIKDQAQLDRIASWVCGGRAHEWISKTTIVCDSASIAGQEQ